MPIDPKPGNQPDPDDMEATFGKDGEADTTSSSTRSTEEEMAARLGDFA